MFRATVAFFDGPRRDDRLGRVILPAVSSRADLAACRAELGMFLEGRAVAEEGLRIAEAAAHHASLMIACRPVGLLALRQGDASALPLLERAVNICQDADLPLYFRWMAATLGAAYTFAGRVDDAVALLTTAMKQTMAMERVSYTHTRSVLSRLALGEAQLLVGQLKEAHTLAEQTLALTTEHHERGNQAYALCLLGEIAAHQAEAEQAKAHYRQALALPRFEPVPSARRRPSVACSLPLSSIVNEVSQGPGGIDPR